MRNRVNIQYCKKFKLHTHKNVIRLLGSARLARERIRTQLP